MGFSCYHRGIGLLYLIINIGAIVESKKMQSRGEDHHVSGVPFLGGIHFLIAGLICPIKWLAILCVLDYTFLSFLYAVFIGDRFDKVDSAENTADNEERRDEGELPKLRHDLANVSERKNS